MRRFGAYRGVFLEELKAFLVEAEKEVAVVTCVWEDGCEVLLFDRDRALFLVILDYNSEVFSFALFVVKCNVNFLSSQPIAILSCNH